MKKLYISLILSFVIGLGSFLYYTKPCYGGYCVWKYECYISSICGPDCVCVSDKPYDISGYCYSSVDLKPDMIILE